MAVQVKRVYERASLNDGVRVLVERKWPPGLSKASARLDHWMKALAPSETLEKWFDKNPERASLQRKYLAELSTGPAMTDLEKLYLFAGKKRPVTLLYAGRNAEINPAVVLKQLLEGRRKPPNGTGPANVAAATKVRAAKRPPR